MSLPFLTTDRVHEDGPPGPLADRPVPPGGRWRRPYGIGPGRVGAAALLLVLTAYLLISALVVELAGTGSRAAVLLVAAVLVTGLALRLLRVGLWVSGDGLRTVSLLRTRTLPWDRVGAVRTVQQPVRWLSLPRTVQGQALLVRAEPGGEMPTLLTDRSPDFLGRPEAFDVAASAVADWAELMRRG